MNEAAANESKKRVPLMAVPIILAVGLLVAAGYVGDRIITSRGHRATAVVTTFTSAPVAAPVAAPAATPVPPAVAAPVSEKAAVPHAGPMDAQHTMVAETKPVESFPGAAIVPAKSAEKSSDGLIEPQHGERYLQIAAISAEAAQKYLAGLGRYNIQASVAPGPHDGLVRVVIGPFPSWESVSAVKAQIQNMWPDCFVRLY